MGAGSSKDTELENALSKFSETEVEKLETLFDSLSSENTLSKSKFQDHLGQFFSLDVIEQISNPIIQTPTAKDSSGGKFYKRDFLIRVSKMLKGSLVQKAEMLLSITTSKEEACLEEMMKICEILIKAYIKAIENSSESMSYMAVGTTEDANKKFAEHLTRGIDAEKEKSNNMAVDNIERWMLKEVLVMRLFEDVFQACFFGADRIIDTRKHGLVEGCEPTLEHVQKKSDILLPCKLDFQGHNIETIIDIPAMLMLNHAVPTDCRHLWRLLFSTSCHGKSFTTFLHRIVYQGPTILLVKDINGAVFGGFASTSWKVKSCFYGDKDCFVFTLKPTMEIYHTTGVNDHYMYLNVGMKTIPNGLGMGGQFEYFGLWLDSEFGPGHSKARPKSTTYGNPQLSSCEDFQVEEVEVWGVGLPPEQEEKERSVLDRETDAQAILDLIGKERKSDGFREPDDTE